MSANDDTRGRKQWEVILRLVVATGDENTYARYRKAGVSFLQAFYRKSADAMGKAALLAGVRALEASALPGLRAGIGKSDQPTQAEIELASNLRQPYDLARCGESLSTEVVLLVGLHQVALKHEELRQVVSPFWPPSIESDSSGEATGAVAGTSDELRAAFDERLALWVEQMEPDHASHVAGCASVASEEHAEHQAAQRAKEVLQEGARMARWGDVATTARSLYALSFQSASDN